MFLLRRDCRTNRMSVNYGFAQYQVGILLCRTNIVFDPFQVPKNILNGFESFVYTVWTGNSIRWLFIFQKNLMDQCQKHRNDHNFGQYFLKHTEIFLPLISPKLLYFLKIGEVIFSSCLPIHQSFPNYIGDEYGHLFCRTIDNCLT